MCNSYLRMICSLCCWFLLCHPETKANANNANPVNNANAALQDIRPAVATVSQLHFKLSDHR